MKWIFKISVIFCLLALSNLGYSAGFRISLYDGKFHGPGNLGNHNLNDGSLENFIVTGPLTGTIPFFNNGGALPNVTAESLHTGPVDGQLSNGTKINENVNAAFTIKVPEPETKQPAHLLICSVSEEIVEPDQNGNLTFKLHAAFDSGFPQDAIQLVVQFSTGAVEVPVSEKTKRGLKGGHDQAGSFKAGKVYIGRLGDFDQDGFLDGVFALAGNTPYELVIAQGDPVLIIRPFKSDIPVSAQEASYYELNGVVKNFPPYINKFLKNKQSKESIGFLADIGDRLNYILKNFDRLKRLANFKKISSQHSSAKDWVSLSKNNIKRAKEELIKVKENILDRKFNASRENFEKAFSMLEPIYLGMRKMRGDTG